MKRVETVGELIKALLELPEDRGLNIYDKSGNEHNSITIGYYGDEEMLDMDDISILI